MGQHLIQAAGVFILPLEIRTLYIWHKPYIIMPPTDLSNMIPASLYHFIYSSMPFFIQGFNVQWEKNVLQSIESFSISSCLLACFLAIASTMVFNGDMTPMNRDIIQWHALAGCAGAGWVIVYNCPRISRALLVSQIRARGELLSGPWITIHPLNSLKAGSSLSQANKRFLRQCKRLQNC